MFSDVPDESTSEPAAKRTKLDDTGNIDGGIQTLLKPKITDVSGSQHYIIIINE